MKDKIIGYAYKYYNNEKIIETYTIIYENDNFLYKPLKKYENVNGSIINELEIKGFKNINYWNSYITEFIRENIKSVKK